MPGLTRALGRLTTLALAAVLALSLGATSAAAAPDERRAAPGNGCVADPHRPKHDFRAMWIASVVNIDWPSRTGLSPAAQQQELINWFDLAVRSKHNAVILQVRPTADAFWPGAKEPWSRYLTGTQGGDPGYDPLQFAVTEAHRRGLQLHAWFNPYRISMNTNLGELHLKHPARENPDWVVPYGGKLYYNPGIPEARKFSIDAIMDAVTRYDIDGVHFDDYFYPYPVANETFNDAAQYAQYGAGRSLADWRRSNIDALITELGAAIKEAKPWVAFGVSPFAIWRNASTDPEGSDTAGGVQTYDDLYADTRRWVREEWIDYVVPQVYWSRGFTVADYEKVTSWWAEQVRGTTTNLYIGQATYKVALNADPNWAKPEELSSHLDFNTRFPEVKGNIYFSGKDVRADRLGATTLLNQTWYSRPALVPESPSLKKVRPALPVRGLDAAPAAGGVELSWTSSRAHQFAVYRVDESGVPDRCALADATHLVAVLQSDGSAEHRWVDPDGRAGSTYLVTSVSRAGDESPPQRTTV